MTQRPSEDCARIEVTGDLNRAIVTLRHRIAPTLRVIRLRFRFVTRAERRRLKIHRARLIRAREARFRR
jgi:hypothetical protein